MRRNIHDWIDGWFLSLSEDPNKLNERIKIFEHSRLLCMVVIVIAIALLFSVIVMSNKNISDSIVTFMFVMIVFMLVINVQMDIYTKVLKLQRQQQSRDGKDTDQPSVTGEKSAIAVIAFVYGPAISALILGFLFFILIT